MPVSNCLKKTISFSSASLLRETRVMSNAEIKIFACGGTIDKIYFDAKSEYQVGQPQAASVLSESNVTIDYQVESILQKDSLDMNEEDRRLIRRAVENETAIKILITHGTDTMIDTALTLKDISGKTIVLTGSMAPAKFRETDAIFNIGFAVAAVQTLPAGIYIAMNARIFDPETIRKNVAENRFEPI